MSSAGSNISEIQVDSSVRGRDGETAKHIPPRNQLVVEVDTVNRVHPAAEAEPAPEPGAEMSNNFVAAGPAGRPGLPGNPALRAPQPAGPGQPHFEDSGRCTLLPTPPTRAFRRPPHAHLDVDPSCPVGRPPGLSSRERPLFMRSLPQQTQFATPLRVSNAHISPHPPLAFPPSFTSLARTTKTASRPAAAPRSTGNWSPALLLRPHPHPPSTAMTPRLR